MDPTPEQFNDQLRQRAHADEIKRRTQERRMSPDERQAAQLESMIAARVTQALNQAFAGFTIQSGTGISVTGTGRNITIAAAASGAAASKQGPQPLPNGDTGDILYHNGSEWVVLNKPGTAGPWFLSNNSTGTVAWVDSTTSCP